MEFIKNGAEFIQQQIDNAEYSVVISGNYEIEKTVVIPSNFHLVLENCRLRMADNTFCNMFTNKNSHTEGVWDENIVIEGRGNVVLDGGNYNGLSEKNQNTDGRPPIYVNNLIFFAKVRGFRVTNLRLCNQRWWATNFIYCTDGYIVNLDFCANSSYIDENGEIKNGNLSFDIYDSICVKNADGIDIRCGCRDIIIENITGFLEDDAIAVTALPGKLEKLFGDEREFSDICNIIIRNVMACSLCSQVRLLAQGGKSIYNVLVDGVVDTSQNRPELRQGVNGVKIGDLRLYGGVAPERENIHNITVKNVMSRAENAVTLIGPIGENVKISNVSRFDTDGKVIKQAGDIELVKLDL